MTEQKQKKEKKKKAKKEPTLVAVYRKRLQTARALLNPGVFQLAEGKATWILYVLLCANSVNTYVGISNDFVKRISSHVGFRKGGAVYTKRRQGIVNHDVLPWAPVLLVTGFQTNTHVRRCERLMHQPHKKKKFREWRSSFCFRAHFSGAVLKGSGIQYRQLALMFALESNPSWIKSVTLHWIRPELRNAELLKKLEDRTHKVVNENVSEANKDFLLPLHEEYKARHLKTKDVIDLTHTVPPHL
jgi:predicted GIY-YIG superfamily endonuclease